MTDQGGRLSVDCDVIEGWVTDFTEGSTANFVPKEKAITPKVAGLKLFGRPIFAYGDAGDPMFAQLKEPGAVGPHLMLPRQWLPGAGTVISMFFPFTESVRAANRLRADFPADEWLHGRIEGQEFITEAVAHLKIRLESAGYETVISAQDSRFWSREKDESGHGRDFTSNWSERHAAFVCGLGTFGLSRGLITEKGIAGRFSSVVTSLTLPATVRKYTEIYEYCTGCGACVKRCPAHAISLEHGKEHELCYRFLEKIKEQTKPRYGCGKCQTGVPCEARRP